MVHTGGKSKMGEAGSSDNQSITQRISEARSPQNLCRSSFSAIQDSWITFSTRCYTGQLSNIGPLDYIGIPFYEESSSVNQIDSESAPRRRRRLVLCTNFGILFCAQLLFLWFHLAVSWWFIKSTIKSTSRRPDGYCARRRGR